MTTTHLIGPLMRDRCFSSTWPARVERSDTRTWRQRTLTPNHHQPGLAGYAPLDIVTPHPPSPDES